MFVMLLRDPILRQQHYDSLRRQFSREKKYCLFLCFKTLTDPVSRDRYDDYVVYDDICYGEEHEDIFYEQDYDDIFYGRGYK